MRTTWLSVWDADGEVAQLRRTGSSIVLERVSPDVEADLRRWVTEGLFEQLGPPGRRQPVRTLPRDPALFDRIAERLRNYGFEVRRVDELPQAAPYRAADPLTFRAPHFESMKSTGTRKPVTPARIDPAPEKAAPIQTW